MRSTNTHRQTQHTHTDPLRDSRERKGIQITIKNILIRYFEILSTFNSFEISFNIFAYFIINIF